MRSERFEKGDSVLKIILIYITLGIFCAISVYPVLNILSISLRPASTVFSTSLKIIPDNATFDNYINAFLKYDLSKWLLNSLIISSLSAFFGVILSVTAGYAFSRFEFLGKKVGLSMLLVTQMFPATMTLLPLYIMLIHYRLSNSFLGLVIVYISTTIPFNIWILKGYFDTIPKSLEESAYVDGANITISFYKITLPLAAPAIALSALFSFMGAWSEYIVARVIITASDKLTLPIGLTNMMGQFTTDWGIYSAAALITAVPVMIIFICLSKYLVGGLTLGSVKG
ncbi:carbohydrate ABC transporter membrane protein 2, CUT1 family [Caloramator quimbayensis]|uniref:Carbohydrate ABC transporter membrane protein 2, CUT1 family n=1 Tax=Caloramator quimbayensis TaxID=1147123 RepID=A0A1T4XNC9_9CLOT|nr:sugar ABC transporter permease [Caloramator quimbayensis]SKA90611.1 carbohydrate ABC transporter membrane protein 2, CUT1 family [Caloramator quimbayensis]